jgi:hypothetical protein
MPNLMAAIEDRGQSCVYGWQKSFVVIVNPESFGALQANEIFGLRKKRTVSVGTS